MRHSLLLLGVLSLCGCSDDGGSGTSAGVSSNGGATGNSSCQPGDFSISGTLDGEAASYSGTISGHAWIQTGTKNTLDVPFAGGGALHAEWLKVAADGETIAITGNVNLPVTGPHGGDTLDFSSGTLVKHDNLVEFQLSGFSVNVQCIMAPCPAGSVSGSLSGCLEWKPF